MFNKKPTIITLGRGDKVINHGTYGDDACVFLSDASQPGSVGEPAFREGLQDNELGKNPVIIITNNEKKSSHSFHGPYWATG